MKRLLALLTAAVLLVALAACTKTPTPSPTTGANISVSPSPSPSPSPTEKPTDPPSPSAPPSAPPSTKPTATDWEEYEKYDLDQIMAFPTLEDNGIVTLYWAAVSTFYWTYHDTIPKSSQAPTGEEYREIP